MPLIKRTYALPGDTLDSFEKQVPPGERSAVLAELLREWLAKRRRDWLRHDIAEGCAAMADVYLQTEKEFHPLEEEVQRGVDQEPQPRRRRARAPRSGRRVRTSR